VHLIADDTDSFGPFRRAFGTAADVVNAMPNSTAIRRCTYVVAASDIAMNR